MEGKASLDLFPQINMLYCSCQREEERWGKQGSQWGAGTRGGNTLNREDGEGAGRKNKRKM